MLLVGSPQAKSTLRDVAREFGIVFPGAKSSIEGWTVEDPFSGSSASGSAGQVLTSHYEPTLFGDLQQQGKKVLYGGRGVGHSLDAENSLVYSVLRGSATTTFQKPSSDVAGTGIPLVSVLQARNNARFAFVGSQELLEEGYVRGEGSRICSCLLSFPVPYHSVSR